MQTNMIIFIMRLHLLFRKHLKLQKSQDLEFFLILQRVCFDVDDAHTSCTSFCWHLNMIIFIMRLHLLFHKHLKLQKSQVLEFFLILQRVWFECGWWSHWLDFVFLTLEYDYFHYETSFTFPQTPETTKIAASRIFLILQRVWFDVDDDHTGCT